VSVIDEGNGSPVHTYRETSAHLSIPKQRPSVTADRMMVGIGASWKTAGEASGGPASLLWLRGDLEGMASMRRDAPYRSGECRDWRKVKTAAWREANRERWRLFEHGVPVSR